MNGLEAIKAMQEGKIVTTGTNIFKIEGGNVLSSYVGSCAELNDGVFRVACEFDFSLTYEKWQPKLTGWERGAGKYNFYISDDGHVFKTCDYGDQGDNLIYDVANYFSTKEKAEEINFKQTLLRRMQRFSDENGWNENDWTHEGRWKYCISYDYDSGDLYVDNFLTTRMFGQVYFASYVVAEQAIEVFKEDLIKYFTYDWSKGEWENE